jgi:hypothetical protein
LEQQENIMHTTAIHPMIGSLGLLLILATGCSQSQDTAYVRDDVYDRPDPRTITASVSDEPAAEEAPQKQQEDYYNAGEAQQYSNPRGYYDMAYNDPYYYGYDRYGFGMMYGTQWGYNSCNNGWNYGYNGGYDPYGYNGFGGGYGCNTCWGSYGWQTGYSNGWPNNYGYGCGNYWGSPYSYGAYGGYGYYGYGGGCYNCYYPIITVGDGWRSNTLYGHRPTFGGGGTGGSGTSAPVGQRVAARDQISLLKPVEHRPQPTIDYYSPGTRPMARPETQQQRPEHVVRPTERPRFDRSDRGTREVPTIENRNQGGGGRTVEPSRDGGGGSSGGGGGRRPR